ncbi:MAG: gfo/Idh/MocA family oxidoreductase, partial [Anaerolineae bacterium]|nr:gfo/Idh/MocA family oxidoreductase [Anaerolineae bacterium]
QGHVIGWEHTFVHEFTHLLDCIVNDKDVAPYGATFLDGYRTDCICAAILESSATQRHIDVQY